MRGLLGRVSLFFYAHPHFLSKLDKQGNEIYSYEMLPTNS